MDANIIQYFFTQGPFAVLFVLLLIWVMRKNDQREQEYKKEIQINREESLERESRLHQIMDKFTSKYDLIIDELRDIKNKFKE